MKRKRNEMCSICLESLEYEHYFTNCNHIFHTPCLLMYISKSMNTKCPICRANLVFNKLNTNFIKFFRRYTTTGKNNALELLHWSIKKNNKKCLQFILKNKNNMFFEFDMNKLLNGYTSLILCVKLNRSNMIHALLKYGASMEIKDKDKKTPLMYACELSNYYMANILLETNSSINKNLLQQKDIFGVDSIVYTIIGGNMNILNLIKKYLSPDFVEQTYTSKNLKLTAFSIIYRQYPMFLKLISYEKNNLQLDIDHNNAAHYACMYDNFEVFLYLYKTKLNMFIEKNAFGENPIHVATRYGNLNFIKYLFAFDKNMKEKACVLNSRSLNIFGIAMKNNRIEILDFLMYGGYYNKSELRVIWKDVQHLSNDS